MSILISWLLRWFNQVLKRQTYLLANQGTGSCRKHTYLRSPGLQLPAQSPVQWVTYINFPADSYHMIICLCQEKKWWTNTWGAEFSNVIFCAMKSSPSTMNVPQPNVPVPITLDDFMREKSMVHHYEIYKNNSKYLSHFELCRGVNSLGCVYTALPIWKSACAHRRILCISV